MEIQYTHGENKVSTKKIQIKDLKVGHKIKTKTKEGDHVFHRVSNIYHQEVLPPDQVLLEFSNGSKLECSTNHPIMIITESGIKQKLPEELSNTDKVISEDGFTFLQNITVGRENKTGYIDITVEDEHTFFASNSESGPMVLTHNSQGGIRNASCTVYFPLWHLQVEDLLVLKNNQGTEETRVRHLDYGVVLSAFFWRRFRNREDITLFDPNEVPDLYEMYYRDIDEFEKLYVKYEKRKDLKKKVISAEELFKNGILKERTDTGRIYLLYVDNVQKQGPFDTTIQPVYQSNLCLTGDSKVHLLVEGHIVEVSLDSLCEQWEFGRFNDAQIKTWENGEIVWKPITAAGITAYVSELIEIETETGEIIKCTPEHKIYTKNRGWVEAQHLEETDELVIE